MDIQLSINVTFTLFIISSLNFRVLKRKISIDFGFADVSNHILKEFALDVRSYMIIVIEFHFKLT